MFSNTLHLSLLVNLIPESCSQWFYIIKRFRDEGLNALKRLTITVDAIVGQDARMHKCPQIVLSKVKMHGTYYRFSVKKFAFQRNLYIFAQ
jgi:hypothetical protein